MSKKNRKSSKNIFSIINIIIFLVVTIILLTLGFYYIKKRYSSQFDNYFYDKQDYPHLNKYEVHGIDISKHNGNLNWDEISKHSINQWELKFVFIRATVALADGNLKEDKQFDVNWEKAKEVGLLRGAYHFYSPTVKIEKQIEIFEDEVRIEKGDLPPVLDVENFERGNHFITKKDLPHIEKWLISIENNYKITPIIYTSKKLYLDYFRKSKFKRYKFWIANYGENLSDIDKHAWTFWQHSEDGKIDRHGCDFDLNVFNGTEEQLLKLCKN